MFRLASALASGYLSEPSKVAVVVNGDFAAALFLEAVAQAPALLVTTFFWRRGGIIVHPDPNPDDDDFGAGEGFIFDDVRDMLARQPHLATVAEGLDGVVPRNVELQTIAIPGDHRSTTSSEWTDEGEGEDEELSPPVDSAGTTTAAEPLAEHGDSPRVAHADEAGSHAGSVSRSSPSPQEAHSAQDDSDGASSGGGGGGGGGGATGSSRDPETQPPQHYHREPWQHHAVPVLAPRGYPLGPVRPQFGGLPHLAATAVPVPVMGHAMPHGFSPHGPHAPSPGRVGSSHPWGAYPHPVHTHGRLQPIHVHGGSPAHLAPLVPTVAAGREVRPRGGVVGARRHHRQPRPQPTRHVDLQALVARQQRLVDMAGLQDGH